MSRRKWDVAVTDWIRISKLLDEGWEPFSVVQREPNSSTHTSQPTVYLRRPYSTESAPQRTTPNSKSTPSDANSLEFSRAVLRPPTPEGGEA